MADVHHHLLRTASSSALRRRYLFQSETVYRARMSSGAGYKTARRTKQGDDIMKQFESVCAQIILVPMPLRGYGGRRHRRTRRQDVRLSVQIALRRVKNYRRGRQDVSYSHRGCGQLHQPAHGAIRSAV